MYHICLFICLYIDTWVASTFWLLRIILLWTRVYTYLFMTVFNSFGYIHTFFQVLPVIGSTARVACLPFIQKRRRAEGSEKECRRWGISDGVGGSRGEAGTRCWCSAGAYYVQEPQGDKEESHSTPKREDVRWPNFLSKGGVICWPAKGLGWKWVWN